MSTRLRRCCLLVIAASGSLRPSGVSALVTDLRAVAPAASSAAAYSLTPRSLEPTELTSLIANGALQDGSQQPMNDSEVEAVRAEFTQYRRKLAGARQIAEDRLVLLRREDQQRAVASARLHATLEGLITVAVSDASKAEVVALLARLDRLHYKQVAMLDRTASYWEARAATEHERTIVVEEARAVLLRLEHEERSYSQEDDEEQKELKTEGKRELKEEQKRLDAWLAQLRDEVGCEANVQQPPYGASFSPSSFTADLERAAAVQREKAKVLMKVSELANGTANGTASGSELANGTASGSEPTNGTASGFI